MIEAALTLTLFLTLVLGMFDLGIAVYRHHVLSHSARQVARQAIVHGKLADRLGKWGPNTYSATAADTNPIVTDFSDPDPNRRTLAQYLMGVDPAAVTVLVEWDDGFSLENPVRVTLSMPHQLLMTSFIPYVNPTLTLTAVSEMPIAH